MTAASLPPHSCALGATNISGRIEGHALENTPLHSLDAVSYGRYVAYMRRGDCFVPYQYSHTLAITPMVQMA